MGLSPAISRAWTANEQGNEPIWADLPDARGAACDALIERAGWSGPAFRVSALTGEGCRELCARVMARLEEAEAWSVLDATSS